MDECFDLAIEQLRMQRHDFMNYFQVILGYIQINKPGNATMYIKEINLKMILLSQIYNIECPYLSLLLNNLVDYLYKMDIEVIYNNEVDYINTSVFSKNISKKKDAFLDIRRKIEAQVSELSVKTVYINLSGQSDNFKLYISNDISFYNGGYTFNKSGITPIIAESEYSYSYDSKDDVFGFILHVF